MNVEIIIADGGPAALAAKKATTTIPIVIGAATTEFLEQQGLVASLARPGGNITGFTISTGTELYGKRLELLREAIPRLSRLEVVWNPNNQGGRTSLRAVETAAKTLGLEALAIEAADMEQLERGLGRAAKSSADAMLTIADAFLWSQRARVISLAARHRLPAMYPEEEFATDGGRAATYVDKILKGTKPADLPVERPSKFQLVINLKTSKGLGLMIPQTLLQRADEIIQ